MAITINSNAKSQRTTKGPGYWVTLDVDLDSSYPNPAGYDVSDQLGGGTVKYSEVVAMDDGSTLRFAHIGSDGTLHAYAASTNGAKGAEVANGTDLSGYTGVAISVWCQ
jgi:hypothetical protein